MRLSLSEVQVVNPVRKSGIGIRGERGGSGMVQMVTVTLNQDRSMTSETCA